MFDLISALLARLAGHLTRHRTFYLLAVLLLTVALVFPCTRLNFSTDMDEFSPDAPEVEARRYIERNFRSEGSLVILAIPRDGSLNDNRVLESILSVERIIISRSGVASAFSVADYIETALLSQGLNLSTAPLPAIDSLLEAAGRDRNVSSLFSDEAILINIGLEQNGGDNEEVGLAVRGIVKSDEHVVYHVLAGFDEDLNQGGIGSLYLLPVSFLLIIGVLYLSLRRLLDVLITLLTIPVVMIWTFGISVLLGLRVTILGAAVPFIVLALGIDYGIHSMNRYYDELNGNRNGGESRNRTAGRRAARRTIGSIGVALFLSSVTTIAAYLSNAVSSIPAVVDFGIMVGIGIFCSFLIMSLALPVFRSLFGAGKTDRKGKDPLGNPWNSLSRILGWSFSMRRNAIIVLTGTLLITGMSAYMASKLDSKFEPGDFLPEDSQWLEAQEAIKEQFPQLMNDHQVLIRGNIADNGTLAALAEFTSLNPVSNSLPMHLSNSNWSSLENEAIHSMLKRCMENDPLLSGVLHCEDGAFEATVIELRGGDIDELDFRPLDNASGISYTLTGSSLTHDIMTDELSSSMLSSLLISIIVCAVVISVVFLSPRIGIITLLPVSIVTVWLLSTMYNMGFSLNVVTIIITVTSIGVGIDYSIHITHSYLSRRKKLAERHHAMMGSLRSSGISLVGAALTTSLGFLVLAFAPMRGFYAFGVLTPIMIMFSLFGAILILPSLLTLSDSIPYLKDIYRTDRKRR